MIYVPPSCSRSVSQLTSSSSSVLTIFFFPGLFHPDSLDEYDTPFATRISPDNLLSPFYPVTLRPSPRTHPALHTLVLLDFSSIIQSSLTCRSLGVSGYAWDLGCTFFCDVVWSGRSCKCGRASEFWMGLSCSGPGFAGDWVWSSSCSGFSLVAIDGTLMCNPVQVCLRDITSHRGERT